MANPTTFKTPFCLKKNVISFSICIIQPIIFLSHSRFCLLGLRFVLRNETDLKKKTFQSRKDKLFEVPSSYSSSPHLTVCINVFLFLFSHPYCLFPILSFSPVFSSPLLSFHFVSSLFICLLFLCSFSSPLL